MWMALALLGWTIAIVLALIARRVFGNYDRHWECERCSASLAADPHVPPALKSRERQPLSIICARCYLKIGA